MLVEVIRQADPEVRIVGAELDVFLDPPQRGFRVRRFQQQFVFQDPLAGAAHIGFGQRPGIGHHVRGGEGAVGIGKEPGQFIAGQGPQIVRDVGTGRQFLQLFDTGLRIAPPHMGRGVLDRAFRGSVEPGELALERLEFLDLCLPVVQVGCDLLKLFLQRSDRLLQRGNFLWIAERPLAFQRR